MGAEQSMPSSAHAYLGEHRATPVALYEKALAAGPRDSPTASNRTNSDSASYDDGEKGGSSASSPAGAEVDLPAVSEAAAMEEPEPDFEALEYHNSVQAARYKAEVAQEEVQAVRQRMARVTASLAEAGKADPAAEAAARATIAAAEAKARAAVSAAEAVAAEAFAADLKRQEEAARAKAEALAVAKTEAVAIALAKVAEVEAAIAEAEMAEMAEAAGAEEAAMVEEEEAARAAAQQQAQSAAQQMAQAAARAAAQMAARKAAAQQAPAEPLPLSTAASSRSSPSESASAKSSARSHPSSYRAVSHRPLNSVRNYFGKALPFTSSSTPRLAKAAPPAAKAPPAASAGILAKQSAISGLVMRPPSQDGIAPAAASPPPWLAAPRTPVKRWPTVTAGNSNSEHTTKRVMARYDTVTRTLHGVGAEVVKAESINQYRGAADVWGDEEEHAPEAQPWHQELLQA